MTSLAKAACQMTTLLLLSLTLLDEVRGHGYLVDPPGRSSMWRYGFNTPINYNDNALWCGGFNTQWNRNGGQCGVCGDPWDGARENEAGGRYATGVIAARYTSGDVITVSVNLTKSHMGWFEFRLCVNNNPYSAVTQECLDSNLLRLTDGTTRYQVRSNASFVREMKLQLPWGVVCTQCVLQWKYNVGNSWGCGTHDSGCCVGCGAQEQFYGCADVAISGQSGHTYPPNINNNNHQGSTTIQPDYIPVNNNNNHNQGSTTIQPDNIPVNNNHNNHNQESTTIKPDYIPVNNNNNNHNQGSTTIQPGYISVNNNNGGQATHRPGFFPINNNNNNPGSGHIPPGFISINGNSQNTPQPTAGIPSHRPVNFYDTFMRCRGLFEAYTDTCRRNCLTGSWCPRQLCSSECLQLATRL